MSVFSETNQNSIPDPSEQIFTCEVDGCGKKFKRKYGFSFGVAYNCPGLEYIGLDEAGKPTYKQYGGYACQESNQTAQHWGCSHAHAVQLAHACIDEHHDKPDTVGLSYAPTPADPLERRVYNGIPNG